MGAAELKVDVAAPWSTATTGATDAAASVITGMCSSRQGSPLRVADGQTEGVLALDGGVVPQAGGLQGLLRSL